MPRKALMALVAATAIPLALLFSHAAGALAYGGVPSSAGGFLPSTSGLAFVNPSPAPRASGLSRMTAGRCGGIAFAALDYHYRGEEPELASASDAYITMRNATSILDNATTFIAWSIAPDDGAWWRGGSVGELTRTRELPRLAGALDAGPAPLGLTRASGLREISRNHQVVAYGIERTSEIARIRVYDPNLPGADDVVLQVDLTEDSAPILQLHGELVVAEWSGLFVERYAPPLVAPAGE